MGQTNIYLHRLCIESHIENRKYKLATISPLGKVSIGSPGGSTLTFGILHSHYGSNMFLLYCLGAISTDVYIQTLVNNAGVTAAFDGAFCMSVGGVVGVFAIGGVEGDFAIGGTEGGTVLQ